jgi:hypothetical protein
MASSVAARAATTTVSTCGWSTSTTAATILGPQSRSTRCGSGCARLHPTRAGLRARLQECTAYASDPGDRTALQQRNLDDILAVTHIPERSLESHLRFSTFTFRDIVSSRLGGRKPSATRVYGTRVLATTRRSTRVSSGSRPTPLRAAISLQAAGRDGNLIQTFTKETEHSALSDSEYASSLAALDA